MAANACGSLPAMSASTLRSSTMPAFFSPATSFEYDSPDIRAAALIRAIHRERKSRRRTRRPFADCIIARSTASIARLYVPWRRPEALGELQDAVAAAAGLESSLDAHVL